LESILKDRRTTNKLLKSGKPSRVDSQVGKIKPLSNRHLGQDKRYLGKVVREVLEDEENKNTAEISDNDECDINLKTDEISSISLVPSHYSRNSSHRSEKEDGKARRQQQRASVVVTGGALTFVLLAALLVTASFLMSPVIEEIFGKHQHTK
jgi:hypothetical protein